MTESSGAPTALPDTTRPDPCGLMFGVGDMGSDDEARSHATGLWRHLAGKAGWQVTVVGPVEDEGQPTVIAEIEVEGIGYRMHLGARKRGVLVDDQTGHPQVRPTLRRAVWVEPIITEELLVDYP